MLRVGGALSDVPTTVCRTMILHSGAREARGEEGVQIVGYGPGFRTPDTAKQQLQLLDSISDRAILLDHCVPIPTYLPGTRYR